MDDAQIVVALVRRCVAGDTEAWEDIVRQYNRRIYNVCYRFTGSADSAEDLAQEVFIKMYRTLDSYSPEKGGFTTWIMTMTRNHYKTTIWRTYYIKTSENTKQEYRLDV